MDESDDTRTTAAEDAAIEAAVLQQVIDLHPVQITLAELLREMGGQFADFGERDALERAIRDLAGVGLLHRNGEFVLPSRAALRFSELLDL